MSGIVKLDDKRDRCRDALDAAYVEVADPERALWPSNDTGAKAAVAELNAALVDYVDSVRACAYKDSDRWSYDPVGGHEFPDGATLPVTLDELEEWQSVKYRDDRTGDVSQVILPVAHARELLRQTTAIARTHNVLDPVETTDADE